MNSLLQTSALVEDKTPALVESANKSAVIPAEDQILLLSRELTVFLNPTRPDFTGALLLYGLFLWQRAKIPAFGYVPKVNGERGCYRSLSQLQAQYPWLSEEAIRKALNRAEQKLGKDFIIDRNNPEARDGKLHFLLSPALIKRYQFAKVYTESSVFAEGLIGMSRNEAMRYGVLEALLLHNLRYVTDPTHNTDPVTDDQKRIYRELSPSKLTERREGLGRDKILRAIIPASRGKISEVLTAMKNVAIIEHPTRKNFYRLTTADDLAISAVTKVATTVTKVAGDVTKVATSVTKVATPEPQMDGNALALCYLQQVPIPSYSNANRNPNSNADGKCLFPSTASLRSSVDGDSFEISANGTKLMELVAKDMMHKPHIGLRDTIEDYRVFRALDYDRKEFIGWELPYDIIELEHYTGKPYSRKAEIKHYMDDLTLTFDNCELPHTPEDLEKLEALFIEDPMLTSEHLREVFHFIPNYSMFLGENHPPRKGHDFWYFARRINNLKLFLRYLPQLIRERFLFEESELYGNQTVIEWEGYRPVFKYDELPAPLLRLAFQNETKVPVTWISEEDDAGNWITRSVFYPEYAGLPTVERAEYDSNPI